MKNKFLEIIKKKWLKSMVLTVLLFAIIVCAYIGIYYGMQALHLTDFDFTQEKIYSISQETKDKLQNLDQEVTISVYNMYEYVNDFAYKYANLNSNIKVEMIENLTAKTEWKTNYGVTDTTSFLVIQSENKEKLLADSDLYTMDYTTYQTIDITEEAITNAILDVTTNIKPKICFLTGHELYSEVYFQLLENYIVSEVNEVAYVDLLKAESTLEDCNLLVITALKEDITEKERDDILNYIHQGGEILLLVDPNLEQIQLPNFNKVLEEYGVSISDGFIIEGDKNQMMGVANFVISPINSNSELVKNITMGLNVCMMNPGKITIDEQEKLEEKKVTAEVLATVSDKAFYRTDLNSSSQDRIASDEDAAEAVVAAMLTKENEEDKVSKIIVFANTAFVTNVEIPYNEQYTIYPLEAYNNRDVILNAISYLTEREDNITIRKSTETVSTYDVTVGQTQMILIIIFAIPIFIILVGIVVWQVRRRKK